MKNVKVVRPVKVEIAITHRRGGTAKAYVATGEGDRGCKLEVGEGDQGTLEIGLGAGAMLTHEWSGRGYVTLTKLGARDLWKVLGAWLEQQGEQP